MKIKNEYLIKKKMGLDDDDDDEDEEPIKIIQPKKPKKKKTIILEPESDSEEEIIIKKNQKKKIEKVEPIIEKLPNKKIILVSDLNNEKVDFSKYDIILISNYDIENLPDNIIDFSYNSYSALCNESLHPILNQYVYKIHWLV